MRFLYHLLLAAKLSTIQHDMPKLMYEQLKRHIDDTMKEDLDEKLITRQLTKNGYLQQNTTIEKTVRAYDG